MATPDPPVTPDPPASQPQSDPPAPQRPPQSDPQRPPQPDPQRPPLAAKALSEAFVGLRYRDTSYLVWSQQQLQATPPLSYLSRSQQSWYSNHGNQPVLVPERLARPQTESKICSVQ